MRSPGAGVDTLAPAQHPRAKASSRRKTYERDKILKSVIQPNLDHVQVD